MMHINWYNIPAVTGITAEGSIRYFRAEEPVTGYRFTKMIVRVDHPGFTDLHDADYRNELKINWMTKLEVGGEWIEVVG